MHLGVVPSQMPDKNQPGRPAPDHEQYSSQDFGVTDTFVQYSRRRFSCLLVVAPGASPPTAGAAVRRPLALPPPSARGRRPPYSGFPIANRMVSWFIPFVRS